MARADLSSSQSKSQGAGRVMGRLGSQLGLVHGSGWVATRFRLGLKQVFFFFFFAGTIAGAWRHIATPLATKFWGLIDLLDELSNDR